MASLSQPGAHGRPMSPRGPIRPPRMPSARSAYSRARAGQDRVRVMDGRQRMGTRGTSLPGLVGCVWRLERGDP
jgi:hypothetical protein